MKKVATFTFSLFALFLTLGIVSCGGGTEESSEDTLLIKEITVEQFFSNPEVADKFGLRLHGPIAAEAELLFSIVNANGDTIFMEMLKGKDLLSEEIDEKGPEEEIRKSIIEAMEIFVMKEKFQSPAIAGDEQPGVNDIEVETWRKIKANPSAIGFFYKIRGPIQRKIAWNKDSKEVLMYYSCCERTMPTSQPVGEEEESLESENEMGEEDRVPQDQPRDRDGHTPEENITPITSPLPDEG